MIRLAPQYWIPFVLLSASCKVQKATEDNGPVQTAQHESGISHGVRLYVSAVNCEVTAEDAARINTLARTTGLKVEVVFAGITNNDSAVVRQAQQDLGLTVPVRLIQPGELDPYTMQYKPTGGAAFPVALVVRSRQLRSTIAGETMPRTLSMLEAAWSTN